MLDPTSVERRIKELKNVKRIAVQHNPEAPRQTETDRGAPEQTTVHQDTPRHIRSDDEEGANLKTQVPSLEMDKIVRLSDAQQDKLKSWIAATLPRTTREVGGWIGTECGIAYESRSGLIALLHRLDMEHRKPKAVSSKLGPDKQAAFIKSYKSLLNHIGDDEAVLFGDAVHPTHAVRPVGCWAPKDAPLAVPQTSGRQRLNIHGAIDLEIGKTRRIEAAKVNAVSTIMLLRSRGCIRASG